MVITKRTSETEERLGKTEEGSGHSHEPEKLGISGRRSQRRKTKTARDLCECGFGSLVLDPQVFHLSFQPHTPNIFTWFSATNAEPAVTRGARINPYDPKTCFAVSALHANERATLQGRQRAFDAGAHGSDVEGMRFAAKHLPIYIHSPDLQRKLHCSSFFAILFHCILHQSYSKAAIEYFGMNRVIFYSKDLEIITEILVPIEDYASFQCSNSMHFSFTCRSAKPRDGFQGGQNIHEPANLFSFGTHCSCAIRRAKCRGLVMLIQ
jgi:hypothetical protein